MGRRLVLGDIHGRYEYLVDVFKKANVDFDNDLIIQVGDIVDRGDQPFTCMDLLMKFKNRVFLVGNHDAAFLDFVHTGDAMLRGNGQEITIRMWNLLTTEEQLHYLTTFFKEQKFYHITSDNICFVHGGFDRLEKIKNQVKNVLIWDRELVKEMMSCKGSEKLEFVDGFKEVYIGHTPTIYWQDSEPIQRGNIINIDTGSGKGGPLTLMDIDTKEYWQSDLDEMDTNKMKTYGILKKVKSDSSQTEAESSGEA